MRVLLDCSQIRAGGGIQAAVALIGNASKVTEDEWHVVLSWELADELRRQSPLGAHRCMALPPSTTGYDRWRSPGKYLPAIERRIHPDVVFTLFGPAWWRAEAPHVVGFARGLMLLPPEIAQRLEGGVPRGVVALEYAWRTWDFRRADRIVVETETVRGGVARVLGYPADRITVVRNSYSPMFHRLARRESLRPLGNSILVPAAYYPHKNLECLPAVAAELVRSLGDSFEFVLTVDASLPAWAIIRQHAAQLGVETRLRNIGPVRHERMPELYAHARAVFLPTLFESSTAAYPEALCMSVPIITSDLPFARELCGDAAVFVDPHDPRSAAVALHQVLTDDPLRVALASRASRVLREHYPSPEEKWQAQRQMLIDVARDY